MPMVRPGAYTMLTTAWDSSYAMMAISDASTAVEDDTGRFYCTQEDSKGRIIRIKHGTCE